MIEKVPAVEKENKKSEFEFKDLVAAKEYLEWKEAVPAGVRQQVEAAMKNKKPSSAQTDLVLTDQFLDTFGKILAKNKEIDLSGIDKRVFNLLAPLERIKTKSGYLNVFETLSNPDVSWDLKRKIYETQIRPALEWLVEKDLEKIAEEAAKQTEEEQKEKKEESDQEDSDVPPVSEKVNPGGDTAERKEGEPVKALFSISPHKNGLYKQLRFNRLDPNTLEWQKPENKFSEPAIEEYDIFSARIISGKIRGRNPLSIPLLYDWTIDSESLVIDAPEGSAEISRNQDGLWYVNVHADGVFKYQVRVGEKQRISEDIKPEAAEISGDLPQELKEKIEELKSRRYPLLKLKREIVKFIYDSLKYATSDELNIYYKQIPEKVFERIWGKKEANCFWSNTLAMRALAEIDDQQAFVSGFSAKEKDENGNTILHSANGHSWLETWDSMSNRVVKLDATPKGDPTVDEQEQEKDLEGETGEGDYGESNDELMSEEKLKEKIRKMKDEKEKKEQEKLTSADLEEARFAELAECSPEQAKEFLKALDRVREIKNERGIPISELLKLEWKKIVTERKIEVNDYRGPVRMDEGDTLEDPVSARIDIMSKEFNPTGFEKREHKERVETEFSGINIYFSFDLSGSMIEADGASGRSKADVQRDVALLFADSLMQCAYISRQRSENSDLLPIKIMVTLASDTGDVKLNLTDKWGPREQWAFYSALNQLAKGGTPTHKTLESIEIDFDRELADLKKKKVPKEKLPLHYAVEVSDGTPDDFAQTEVMHKKLKSKGMAIRSYCIGGESASEDAAPQIETFSQLPEILSKDIREEFKKLNPKRIRQ